MSVSAKELLKEISPHDQSVMDVLSERPEGFTIVQIADKLKRPRKDVKYSVHNLKIGGHVKNYPYYGRVCLVDFDFKKQVIEKRPHEYVEKLEQRINQLERELQAEREINDRLRVVETERAERNDELYEVVEKVANARIYEQEISGQFGGVEEITYISDVFVETAREVIDKHPVHTCERPMYYIAVKYSRGLSSQMYSSREKALEENPYADEIIPVRLQENLDEI